ncbi:BnaC02g24320D [Brassica napus]|uniref:BnaC02g24320D protein n=1 Tax=Brassica napus TaxID=3708 RepID=A0A078G4T0_BRANA|nr:BnaC02g24320D [Brassica napus]
MAPLMCSSPPSRLCLPSSPSRLRPLPDPPPYLESLY